MLSTWASTTPSKSRFVTQSILAGDPSGRPGNCLQAAVATVLGVEPGLIPHFAEYQGNYIDLLVDVFARYEYQVEFQPRWVTFGLLFGHGPRGNRHAVAVVDNHVWDPHPSRAGLEWVDTRIGLWKTVALPKSCMSSM